MNGLATRLLPYSLAFLSSLCIMILELVASRLVARHVGSSLIVWNGVIGIMLGGICLGNVLGGRLADRVDPRRAVGPLFALGSALTLGCLWLNSVGGLITDVPSLPWLKTIALVTIDFLIPGTLLGMIGPVVAKMAVEQSRKTGSAIGDVYTMGAIGSIVGTFLAGFVLLYYAPISVVVTIVAAALAVLAGLLIGDAIGLILGLITGGVLALGSTAPLIRQYKVAGIDVGGVPINFVMLAGHLAALILAMYGIVRLVQARRVSNAEVSEVEAVVTTAKPRLADLSALSFVASLAFMAFEMAASRFVTHHLGSSIYGWTSVIGVLLAGLSLGNFLGGKVADRITVEKQASWLFLVASVFVLSVIVLESPPRWLVWNPIEYAMGGAPSPMLHIQHNISKDSDVRLLPSEKNTSGIPSEGKDLVIVANVDEFLHFRVFDGNGKIAVDTDEKRLPEEARHIGYLRNQINRWWPPHELTSTEKGRIINSVISITGLSPSVPALTTAIYMQGTRWWARVLYVVTLVFFLPAIALGTVSPVVAKLAVERVRASKRTGSAIGQVYAWGMVGSIVGTFLTGFFLIDVLGTKGVILLLATLLALSATMLGSIWHAAWAGVPLGLCVIAFMPLPALERQGLAWGIREEKGDPNVNETTGKGNPPAPPAWSDESNYYFIKVSNQKVALDNKDLSDGNKRTIVLDNLEHGYFTLGNPDRVDYPYEYIYGLVSHRVAKAKAKAKDPSGEKLDNVGLKTLFFGGGAYTFPRYLQYKYPGTLADVAEIDPAITKANENALGLGSAPSDKDIKTTWGDARAFVVRNQDKRYDLIFGDAFNDFSVPWHMTTREFNDKVANMLDDKGVYMINIIDVYTSDDKVESLIKARIAKLKNPTDSEKEQVRLEERAKADRYTGFLGAWVETARMSFKHVAIYGTDEIPGLGQRETFVVVVSNADLDLDDLGSRKDDPKFFYSDKLFEPKPFEEEHLKAIAARSRGIILTDDYAPVDNLLAPVAATRGNDD